MLVDEFSFDYLTAGIQVPEANASAPLLPLITKRKPSSDDGRENEEGVKLITMGSSQEPDAV